MVSVNYDWEHFVRILMYSAPNFLCWCFAVFFCLTRRRENPKGATLLGLAVMVSFFTHVIWQGWPYLLDMLGYNGVPYVGGIEYLLMGFHAVTTIVFWLLMVMAVFARPMHYDFVGSPAFDDDVMR